MRELHQIAHLLQRRSGIDRFRGKAHACLEIAGLPGGDEGGRCVHEDDIPPRPCFPRKDRFGDVAISEPVSSGQVVDGRTRDAEILRR